MKDLDIILSEGEGYSVEFKETADKTIASEVCAFANAAGGRIFIGVDDGGNIYRRDLPLSEKFNDAAYKRYIRTAKISDVHERETVLLNLSCVAETNGTLFFTNTGALFFRKNDEDVKFRHAGLVCALYKGTEKDYIIDAKNFLKQNRKGKNADFSNILGLSSQRVREILQEMTHNNLVEKHGDKRHTFYTIKK